MSITLDSSRLGIGRDGYKLEASMTEHKRRIDMNILNELNEDLACFAEAHDIDAIDLIVSLKLTLDDLAERAGVDLLGIEVADPQPQRTIH